MKKILIINSSFRKKTTYDLLMRIGNQFKSEEVEFLNMKDFEIKPCIGCENCLRNGSCGIDDQADEILGKISSADGIIIGTPVYLRQISGYLKLLIDRGCAWYHRSPLVGKPIMFVTTTQASGAKQALKYLKDLSVQWGTIYAGHVSRTGFNMEKALNKADFNKFRRYLDESNRRFYRPTLKQMIEFNTQKVLAENILPLDYEYWTEKGYMDKPYYYECRITLSRRIISRLFYMLLSFFIKKGKS